MTRQEINVRPARQAFGYAVIVSFCALMIAFARSGGPLGAALAAPLFTIPLISLGEWLVHGVLYHGRLPGLKLIRDIHHAGHYRNFPVQSGAVELVRNASPTASTLRYARAGSK